MGWTLFFMIVILKIPLAAALYLVWYAIKEQPAPEERESGEDRRPRRKLPPQPRWPRRGPAGGGASCKPVPCAQESGVRLAQPALVTARRSSD